MNEQHLKLQAERVRSLAAAADPFTRKRLLDLARRYDERLKGRSSRHVSFLANLPEQRLPERIQHWGPVVLTIPAPLFFDAV